MMSVELSHSVTEGDRQGAPENLVSQVVSVRAAVDVDVWWFCVTWFCQSVNGARQNSLFLCPFNFLFRP